MFPAERIYRLLLWLYPFKFRAEYGESMLQHARDLGREVQAHDGQGLLALCWLLLKDGIRNVAIENWEALLNENKFSPASWLTVLLAAFPGLLMVASRSNVALLGTTFQTIVSLGYLALLVVGVPLLWRRDRRFPAWALLPAGLLAWFAVYLAGVFLAEQWNTFGLLKPFSGAIESGRFLLQIILILILFAVLLRGQRLPLSVWLTLSAYLLVNLIIAIQYIAYWPKVGLPTGIIQFLTVSGFVPIEGLFLVAVGLLAVRQHGLRALLVVIGGFSYMCLDSDYFSGPNFNQWAGYTAFAASLIFLYLIVTPVAMLRARTRLAFALATFVPFSIFQVARVVVPTFVLQGQFTVPWESIGIILILVLAWYLYSHVSETAEQSATFIQTSPESGPSVAGTLI